MNYRRPSHKPAFTLIEMLIAVSIFAVTVVVTASIFGSSSNMQVSTKATVNNVEYSQLINNNIFNDLKSATGWYKVVPKNSSGLTEAFQIKGLASFEYNQSTNKLNLNATETSGNLVIGAKDNGDQTKDYIIYYFDGGKLYGNTVKESECKFLASDSSASAPGMDCNIFSIIYNLTSTNDHEIRSDGSQIQSLVFTGTNYLVAVNQVDEIKRQQPFIEIDLVVKSSDLFGGGSSNVLETKNAISSRNFQERPQ